VGRNGKTKKPIVERIIARFCHRAAHKVKEPAHKKVDMRCDQCGLEILPGEKLLSTTADIEGAPIGTRAYPVRGTRTIPLVLCATCAARRNSSQRWFLWAFLLMIGGMILAAILVGMLPR
jgi:hypothetical protein